MRSEVTAAEQARYREQGFLVLEGFLDEHELAEWRSAFDDAIARRVAVVGDQSRPGQAIGELAPQELDTRPEVWPAEFGFTQCMNLWKSDPEIRRLLHDERIGRIAADLAGVDGIRVWYDQTFVKEPWAGPTPLHQDDPYWSFTSPDALSIWVALDDADLTNGALCYLPGTHLTHSWKQADDVTPGAIFGVYPEWESIEPVFCPVAAGAALFHNGLTVHGSGANMTPRPRRVMNCAFMPDGATFNGIQNVLTDEVFASYQVGDVLDDDTRNPLVFSRRVRVAG